MSTSDVTKTTFLTGDKVRFVSNLKDLLTAIDPNQSFDGEFTVLGIEFVPRTNLDPFSPDYQGERSGQDAVGHNQLLMLDREMGKTSGALLELVV